jgi:hypothetical protein
MYPGLETSPGISHEFTAGLHLIAGVNGLGKSTFLMMLYRGLIGDAAIKNDNYGAPKPELARNKAAKESRTFASRVADGAKAASLEISFQIGDDLFSVKRALGDLKIQDWTLNSEAQQADESVYRQSIIEAMNVSDFATVVTVLNLIVFMFEDRDLLMWDDDAQTNALQALLMSPTEAAELATKRHAVSQANSTYRNLLYHVNRDENRLLREKKKHEEADAHTAEYRALQSSVSAHDESLDRLRTKRFELEEERSTARQGLEVAKHQLDELKREVEALRLARIASAFPSAEDSSLYVLARLLGDKECSACGAENGDLIAKWESALSENSCALCGAAPENSEDVVPPEAVDTARLERASKRLEKAKETLSSAKAHSKRIADALDSVQNDIDQKLSLKSEKTRRIQQISGLLPESAHALSEAEKRLKTQKETLNQIRRDQLEAEAEFAEVFDGFRSAIEARADQIREQFASRISEFLVETAEISLDYKKRPVGESGAPFDWPVFRLSMTSGAFGAPVARTSRSQVSMSQGEFIDLAFRLALVEAALPESPCSLIFDAPEASLDALFMRRAGAFLSKFTTQNRSNRLIVTSNLTNTDMIPALFGAFNPEEGDPTPTVVPREERRDRVIDLLTLAAPTRAVEKVGNRYQDLLDKALFPPYGAERPGL